MTHAKVDEASDKMHKAVVHLQDEFGAIHDRMDRLEAKLDRLLADRERK